MKKEKVRYDERHGHRFEAVTLPTRDKPPKERHIGCSVGYLRAAVKATKSSARLAVALYVYKLCIIKSSKTVEVPNGWLEKVLDISRFTKARALANMAGAGLIVLHDRSRRESTRVTLLVD
jgi:hypothetical protein